MTMKTHPNFKTAIAKFSNADTIYKCIREPLLQQHMFIKATTPWEEKNWNKGELKDFEINLDDVDRLYYIDSHRDYGLLSDIGRYKVVVRIEYNGPRNCSYISSGNHISDTGNRQPDILYVELSARYDCLYHPNGMFSRSSRIFISRDARLFMSLVLGTPSDSVYELLAEDGIIIEQQQDDPPSLKYLCHSTVFVNRDRLDGQYKIVLPKMLSDSVEYFIRIREAEQYYSRLRCLGIIIRN